MDKPAAGTELRPVGAHQRLRVLALASVRTRVPTVPRTSAPMSASMASMPALASTAGHGTSADAMELAWIDVVVGDAGVQVGPVTREVWVPRWWRRGPGHPHPGTPGMPLHLLWHLDPPDVLVAHDVAQARAVLPEAVTGPLPWIGLGRVARQVLVNAPSVDADALASWLGLPGLELAPGPGQPFGLPRSAAARKVARTAALLLHLLQDPAVQHRLADACRHADRLRPTVGSRLGHPVVQVLAGLTAAVTQPVREPPASGDDAGWAACPADDLRWWSEYVGFDDGATPLAWAELERRRRAGIPEQPPLPVTPPLLLRQARTLLGH